jgi:hypothetical protein
MLNGILSPARTAWEGLQERLFFLPPFPDELDSLALFSMLLVVGLLVGEWFARQTGLAQSHRLRPGRNVLRPLHARLDQH